MIKSPLLLLVVAVVCAALAGPSWGASASDFLALSYTDAGGTTPYRLYVPPTYNASKQYPLVLFLHGAGEKGTDNLKQIGGNINNLLAHVKLPQYESLLVAPQAEGWWGGDETRRAKEIVKLIQTQYNIHPDQVFCTGLSMGGGGTWDMASRFTDEFDVYVPICGTGTFYQYAPLLVDKPIWAFHAADDTTVSVSYSRLMIQAIQNAGGNPKYTEYATGGHGIWGRAYNEASLYQWMYSFPIVEPYGPRLVFQKEELGDGLYGFTFSIYNNDEKLMPYTVAMGFQGTGGATIKQIKSGGTAVNKEGSILWDEESQDWVGDGAIYCDQLDPAYDMARDTWVFNPFGDNAMPGINPITGGSINGFYNASNAFALSCYSGTGSALGSGVDLAYVVADGNVTWTGTILRDGTDYETEGVTDVVLGPLGDFNGDGTVTHGDYTVWADHFGFTIAAVRAEHPEFFPVGSYLEGATAVTQGLYTTWADHFGDTRVAPLTVTEQSVPAVADAYVADEAPTPAVTKRAERIAARKQLRLERAAQRHLRRSVSR